MGIFQNGRTLGDEVTGLLAFQDDDKDMIGVATTTDFQFMVVAMDECSTGNTIGVRFTRGEWLHFVTTVEVAYRQLYNQRNKPDVAQN